MSTQVSARRRRLRSSISGLTSFEAIQTRRRTRDDHGDDNDPFRSTDTRRSELANLADAIKRGHAAGDGFYTAQCHEHLEGLLGVPKVLLTTSCTHALEMAALLLDIGLATR